jgi:predicted dehydrogenase
VSGERDPKPGFHVGLICSPHPHAAQHLRTLAVVSEVEAIHICGLAGQDPQALADEAAYAGALAKVRDTTQDPTDLLADPHLDALLVCVRNDLCPALLDAAIEAGKPVLFEKPGALRAVDLRGVAGRARQRGVALGTFFQWRGHPVIQEVKQAIAGGALGRIMAVEARMVTSQVRYRDPSHWLFRQDTAGSGILSWLACHYLDVLCFLLEDRIVEVAAMTGRQSPEPIEVEDTACLALRFGSGVLGTLHAGYHLAGSVPGYAGAAYDTFLGLRGTEGYARLPLSDGLAYTLYSQASGWAAGGRRERRFELPASPAYGGKPGEYFLLDFLHAARDRRAPLAPIEAAVHVLELVEAALQSSASGRSLRVGATEAPPAS